MINNLNKLEKRLKIEIKKKSLLIEALTHKSTNKNINNEKLEFLGDRVIGLVLAKKLLDLYPNKSEGILDKRFANLVNKKTCADIGWSLGLKDFILLGDKKKSIKRKDEKILSDACEAIIGAVYVDRGYNYAEEFVVRIWRDFIKESNITILDSKTKLQEHSLKLYKKLPIYRLLGSRGPRHNPVFKISVKIQNSEEFIGFGNSKKQAQQDAANKLLTNINLN